jgi:hypothetical protein
VKENEVEKGKGIKRTIFCDVTQCLRFILQCCQYIGLYSIQRQDD